MVLATPITKHFAQDSYERIRTGFKKGAEEPMTPNEPLYHFMIQAINMLADIGPKVMMISSATPNVASYYYQGVDKIAYRASTSPAYRVGAKIGEHLVWPSSTPILVGSSKKAVAARAVMAKGAHIGGRIGTKLIPGIGWGLLIPRS